MLLTAVSKVEQLAAQAEAEFWLGQGDEAEAVEELERAHPKWLPNLKAAILERAAAAVRQNPWF